MTKKKRYEELFNGSIHIERNFLSSKIYNQMFEDIQKLKYDACHQPYSQYFGNRFQGYPVYETIFKKYDSIQFKVIEKLIECKITNAHSNVKTVIA